MITNLISALKLDQKDPAIALNYSIFLYNRSCKDDKSDENDPEMYNEAVNKIQLFEVRVKRLRDGGSGVDADPDVLMAASSCSAAADAVDAASVATITAAIFFSRQHSLALRQA